MAKSNEASQKSGAAVTQTSAAEVNLRDVLRTAKRYKKVTETLVEMKSKSPAIAQAIEAVKAETAKLKLVAQKMVADELDNI